MRVLPALLVAVLCMTAPVNSWGNEAHVLFVAVELQNKLLSLELPARGTDRKKISDAMDGFARKYGFTASGEPSSPLWNIQRFYVGPHYTSVILSFFPEHTFVGLSKRPGDADGHQELVDALTAAFGPLGFRPWVEPAE